MFDASKRILDLREKQGLSQYALAKSASIAQPSLLAIEKGRTTPNLKSLEKLCAALGITLAEFFATDSTQEPLEGELLSAFRKLDEEKKQQAIRVIKSL